MFGAVLGFYAQYAAFNMFQHMAVKTDGNLE